ncbi:MAG: hypothetical protein RMK29_02480 [Myxococcales bacterium]|nr:hypothetical protein [Myxococcota bacterium]MDW8280547.1 hypothetical protein [Myxococcales bacterium]
MRGTAKMLGVTWGLLLAAAGCGGSGDDECHPDKISGTSYKFATNSIKLPTSAMSYALDIDGDMRPDNQLRAIVGAISSANFDLQGPVDKSVADGEAVILVDLVASDLMNGCAKATLYLANRPMGKPKFDGTDSFTINTAQKPTVLYGKITAGKMSSILPKDQKNDQVQTIQVKLPLAMGELPLTLYGVHAQGNVTEREIKGGELHGVIRKADIDTQIIPAVASLLTDQIRKNPTGSATETIIRLFEDTMGNEASKKKCMMTPAKCCSTPATRQTCEILPDEVRSNALIGNVLAADVQVFQDGMWNPVPKGTMKDAMSVGLGYTAVRANF